MKLYTAANAPNPRIVDMIIYEKGLCEDIPRQIIDLAGGENRQPAFLAINPLGQLPVLETDEGFVIGEVTAIAEYLEEYRPDPFLVGASAAERAEARMWARRLDLRLFTAMSLAFQHGSGRALFEKKIKIWPEIVEAMEARVQEGLAWVDGLLADKPYLCGTRLTYGDIMLYAYLDFFDKFGQPIDPSLTHLVALCKNISQRESAKATAGESKGK